MENILKNGISIQELLDWNINKNTNPRSLRKIKSDGVIYKNYKKTYEEIFPDNFNYFDANEKDPVTLEEIWVNRNDKKTFVYPNYKNLILYKDNENFINCFEKETINNFVTQKIKIHPSTFIEIPEHVFELIEYKEVVVEKNIKERTLEIFQIFTNISIFIDHDDFLKLDDEKLGKLYYETHDFFYKNLDECLILQIKQFSNKKNKNIYYLDPCEYKEIAYDKKQEVILDSFEMLLTFNNEQIKCMSYYIILGGLSLVIPKIKDQYPDFCFSF